jgi:methionyl-tRNA synthetase
VEVMVIRTTIIRKNQIYSECEKELLKGSKVIVKTYVTGRTVKRAYYCQDCGQKLS